MGKDLHHKKSSQLFKLASTWFILTCKRPNLFPICLFENIEPCSCSREIVLPLSQVTKSYFLWRQDWIRSNFLRMIKHPWILCFDESSFFYAESHYLQSQENIQQNKLFQPSSQPSKFDLLSRCIINKDKLQTGIIRAKGFKLNDRPVRPITHFSDTKPCLMM